MHDDREDARRYGEVAISEASLEPLPNPAVQRDYLIELSSPEFTCLCPRSGYPDFATIQLKYIPDQAIVELRSFKLYLNRYRDEHIFHEAAVNRILDDFVAACQPRWAEVVGDFNVRGNVKTVITVEYQNPKFKSGRLTLSATNRVGKRPNRDGRRRGRLSSTEARASS